MVPSTPARRARPGLLRRWLARVPTPCACCGLDPGDPLCAGCREDFFPATRASRCPRCALPVPAPLADLPCGACSSHPPDFDATLALADYAPPADGMVLALKFGRRLDLATVFGVLLARAAAGVERDQAFVTAVPLAHERHAERGYNQSHEIAVALARASGVPLAPQALLRTRHAAPQASLPLAGRRAAVRGAFRAAGPLPGRHAWLVDDVMTSGSTLAEAAAALRVAGVQRVTALVVCRTPA